MTKVQTTSSFSLTELFENIMVPVEDSQLQVWRGAEGIYSWLGRSNDILVPRREGLAREWGNTSLFYLTMVPEGLHECPDGCDVLVTTLGLSG